MRGVDFDERNALIIETHNRRTLLGDFEDSWKSQLLIIQLKNYLLTHINLF